MPWTYCCRSCKSAIERSALSKVRPPVLMVSFRPLAEEDARLPDLSIGGEDDLSDSTPVIRKCACHHCEQCEQTCTPTRQKRSRLGRDEGVSPSDAESAHVLSQEVCSVRGVQYG